MTEKLKGFAKEIGKPLSQIAINWLIKQDAVTSVICSVRNIHHVEGNVASVEWELTDEMMTQIEEILAPYQL